MPPFYSLLQPVKTFKAPNFFTFHYANAFYSEDGATLHVDMGAYDDPAILNDLLLSPLVSPGPQQQVSRSSLRRMSIPLEGEEGTMLEVRGLGFWGVWGFWGLGVWGVWGVFGKEGTMLEVRGLGDRGF